jgi:hypothetical protein
MAAAAVAGKQIPAAAYLLAGAGFTVIGSAALNTVGSGIVASAQDTPQQRAAVPASWQRDCLWGMVGGAVAVVGGIVAAHTGHAALGHVGKILGGYTLLGSAVGAAAESFTRAGIHVNERCIDPKTNKYTCPVYPDNRLPDETRF